MPHSISSRDGWSSPPTQNVPPRSPRRGRGPARGRRPSCIPSQVSGVEPKAFDSRIAISTEILVRPFTGSESACRVPPSPWAARVTVKSASLSGRRSRQGDLSRASELQLGDSGYGWFLAQWFRHLRIVGSTTSFKYREPMDFPHQADWPAADGWLKVRMSTRSPAIRATSGIAGPS